MYRRPHLSPSLPRTFTHKMGDASGTTSPTPPSTHADCEGLAPVPPKKPLLPSVFSWLVDVVRKYPFLSATLLYASLVGGIARATRAHYWLWDGNFEFQVLDEKMGRSGVSFSLVLLALVGLKLTRHIVGRCRGS